MRVVLSLLAADWRASSLIVEIKAVERRLPIHRAPVLTYSKLTGLDTALLVNFNVPSSKTAFVD